MKLMSYRPAAGGADAWGVVEGDSVVDCTALAPTLRAALAAGTSISAPTGAKRTKLAEVTFLPPIPDPEKIICIGLNYRTHILETGREPPTKPMIFTRWANTQVGHQQPIIRPQISDHLDFEGEMAVIISKPGTPRQQGERAFGGSRIQLLQRRFRPRLAAPHGAIHAGQELPGYRRLRPMDRDAGRGGRHLPFHAHHPRQW